MVDRAGKQYSRMEIATERAFDKTSLFGAMAPPGVRSKV
jgi:hypothetical protein